ncbi:MAG: hypothetical protein ACMXYB_04380 [Candidatus Woesearchaeota archaeon]
MANMILEFRVMPEDGETEFSELESSVKEVISNYHESVKVRIIEPQNVGFGLQAVRVEIEIDENCGSEDLENKLADLELAGEVNLLKMDRL